MKNGSKKVLEGTKLAKRNCLFYITSITAWKLNKNALFEFEQTKGVSLEWTTLGQSTAIFIRRVATKNNFNNLNITLREIICNYKKVSKHWVNKVAKLYVKHWRSGKTGFLLSQLSLEKLFSIDTACLAHSQECSKQNLTHKNFAANFNLMMKKLNYN